MDENNDKGPINEPVKPMRKKKDIIIFMIIYSILVTVFVFVPFNGRVSLFGRAFISIYNFLHNYIGGPGMIVIWALAIINIIILIIKGKGFSDLIKIKGTFRVVSGLSVIYLCIVGVSLLLSNNMASKITGALTIILTMAGGLSIDSEFDESKSKLN